MLNNKQLLCFITLVDTGSFTAAAKALYMTQPAISWHVKNLEEELCTILIEKQSKDIKLSEHGKILYAHAKTILNQHEMLMNALSEGDKNHIRIAASTLPGEYLLSPYIRAFQKTHKDISISVDISDSKNALERLLNAEVNLAIVGNRVTHSDLDMAPFARDRLLFVRSKNSSTDGQKDLQNILKCPLVLREYGSSTREAVTSYLDQQRVRYQSHVTLGSSRAVLSAIEADLGIGWVSEHVVGDALALGKVQIIHEAFSIERQFHIVTIKGKKISPLTKQFMKCLLDKA